MESPFDPPALPAPAIPPAQPEGMGWMAFKVPWGEAPDGRLVRARNAARDLGYRCPGCGSGLQLRNGNVRSPHFAHDSHANCSSETALHQAAKHRIAQVLRNCTRGRRTGSPRLRVPCSGFPAPDVQGFTWTCPGVAWMPLSELGYDEVAVERSTPDGLRPDVLLLRQGQPVLGIEILVTHAVDGPKAARATHPWVELEAARILASPRRWKPCQVRHPWRGICRSCQGVRGTELSECPDADDLVAQLAASCFAAHVQDWLRHGGSIPQPAVLWRCPWCRRCNQRPLRRERVRWAAAASGLGPPIHPQVIIIARDGTATTISFGSPANPFRPSAITPMPGSGWPALRATPGLDHPHRLILSATNASGGIICKKCGRDCLGSLPSPWAPVPHWQAL